MKVSKSADLEFFGTEFSLLLTAAGWSGLWRRSGHLERCQNVSNGPGFPNKRNHLHPGFAAWASKNVHLKNAGEQLCPAFALPWTWGAFSGSLPFGGLLVWLWHNLRPRKSRGVIIKCEVPSDQYFFKRIRIRPSAACDSLASEIGGRPMYLKRRSSPSRSSAEIAMDGDLLPILLFHRSQSFSWLYCLASLVSFLLSVSSASLLFFVHQNNFLYQWMFKNYH